LELPSLEGERNAVLIVTSNWNPRGEGGLYVDHVLGVFLDGRRWAIFNEDMAPMTEGASFNVMRAPDGFVHRAYGANIAANYTILDHPALNGEPDALVLVTPNWNPG